MPGTEAEGFYLNLYGSKRDTHSLTYRKNMENIRNGNVPSKYTRLLPCVPGRRVLEIGSAEGVMSLSMAREKERVFAVEFTPKRYQAAVELKAIWQSRGIDVANCELVLGDIFEHLDLLDEVDTVVADRVIYYFGEKIPELFGAIGRCVANVVLGGNGARIAPYLKNGDGRNLGGFAKYATIGGMRELLESVGYEIVTVIETYHPIVVGRKTLGDG